MASPKIRNASLFATSERIVNSMFTSQDVYSRPVVLRGAVGMKHAAFSRGIALMAAAAATLVLGGCSASSSRFDFPAFNLTSSGESASTVGSAPPQMAADPATTASLPVPPESVYASGPATPAAPQGAVARAGLPPIQSSSAPRPMPASYSPQTGGAPHVQTASYGGAWRQNPRP